MILAFKLSMPNVGSWNSKWSGEDHLYIKTKAFYGKSIVKALKIASERYYHYNFGDGWSAAITVSIVDAKEASKLRKKSKGFCGYDWMIDSIIDYNEILNSIQIKKKIEENLSNKV